LNLHVFDICNDSEFPSAPTVTPDEFDYWTGYTGDLVLDVAYEDTVSATTANVCGDYEIKTTLDSDASNFVGGPIDSALTSI